MNKYIKYLPPPGGIRVDLDNFLLSPEGRRQLAESRKSTKELLRLQHKALKLPSQPTGSQT